MNKFLKSTLLMPLLLQASISSAIEHNNNIINQGKIEEKDLQNKAHHPDFYIGDYSASARNIQQTVNLLNYTQFANNLNNYHTSLQHKGYEETKQFGQLLNLNLLSKPLESSSLNSNIHLFDTTYSHIEQNVDRYNINNNIFSISKSTLKESNNTPYSLYWILFSLISCLLCSVISISVLLKKSLRSNFLRHHKKHLYYLRNKVFTILFSLRNTLMIILSNRHKHYCSQFFHNIINLQNT